MTPRVAPSRILAIVDFCGPGEAIRVAPHLSALRHHYPTAHVTLLAGEEAHPVVAQAAPFDRILISRIYSQRSRLPLLLRLKKMAEAVRLGLRLGRGYDLVITFQWGSTMLHILGRLAARGPRLGYAREFPALLSSRLGAFDFSQDPVEQNLAILRLAGVDAIDRVPPRVFTEADTRGARRLLEAHGLAGPRPFAVVHPGSDWACQQWVADRWAEVADALIRRLGLEIVFTGSARERESIDAIRARMRAPSVTLAGQTTLNELAAFLPSARLCVCVDSAICELSQAAGTPTVVLAGPSRPVRLPGSAAGLAVVNRTPASLRLQINRCKTDHVPQGGCLDYRCPMSQLRGIAPADVIEAVERLLPVASEVSAVRTSG